MTQSKRASTRVSQERLPGVNHPPQTSGRYTPATPAHRVRPRWHRWAGWAGVVLGVLIAAVNDLMLIGEDVILLPGGHSELYLLLGITVAAAATRLLGLFDRGTTVYE